MYALDIYIISLFGVVSVSVVVVASPLASSGKCFRALEKSSITIFNVSNS